jgi:hypothetical protein
MRVLLLSRIGLPFLRRAHFSPAANIVASGSFLRGTGGISLTIS